MISFLSRAIAWFNGQGIEWRRVMSGNGHAYISKACRDLGLKHIRTRPFTPRTNGKAELYGFRPTASTSRPSARNGPMPWPSRTPRSGTAGCLATWGSIPASGSTQPWADAHFGSGLLSCSADERGETQQLGGFCQRRWGQITAGSRPTAARCGCGKTPAAPASAWARDAGDQSLQAPFAKEDGHRAAAVGIGGSGGGQPPAYRVDIGMARAPTLGLSLLGERLPVAARAGEFLLFEQQRQGRFYRLRVGHRVGGGHRRQVGVGK
jgi:hypothetical protein